MFYFLLGHRARNAIKFDCKCTSKATTGVAMLHFDQIESMEEMVEGVVHLCDCGPHHTGQVEVSLDLIATHGLEVRGLDGGRWRA